MVFTIALTDVQQQNAHFPLETHAPLPHGNDYITLMTSRVAALLALSIVEHGIRRTKGPSGLGKTL